MYWILWIEIKLFREVTLKEAIWNGVSLELIRGCRVVIIGLTCYQSNATHHKVKDDKDGKERNT